jgi:hypothetical protein
MKGASLKRRLTAWGGDSRVGTGGTHLLYQRLASAAT